MESVINALANWGCDIRGAVARFAEDREMYISYVIKFSNDKEFALMLNAVEEKKYVEGFEHAHSLKGVSGNLGLTPLYVSISNLVEALRHEKSDDLESIIKKVKEQISIYQKIIIENSER